MHISALGLHSDKETEVPNRLLQARSSFTKSVTVFMAVSKQEL